MKVISFTKRLLNIFKGNNVKLKINKLSEYSNGTEFDIIDITSKLNEVIEYINKK